MTWEASLINNCICSNPFGRHKDQVPQNVRCTASSGFGESA